MTASGFVFTVFLTLSKVQSAEYDPGFLAFFRSFIALILTLPVIMQQGWGIMRIHQPGLVPVAWAVGPRVELEGCHWGCPAAWLPGEDGAGVAVAAVTAVSCAICSAYW